MDTYEVKVAYYGNTEDWEELPVREIIEADRRAGDLLTYTIRAFKEDTFIKEVRFNKIGSFGGIYISRDKYGLLDERDDYMEPPDWGEYMALSELLISCICSHKWDKYDREYMEMWGDDKKIKHICEQCGSRVVLFMNHGLLVRVSIDWRKLELNNER